MKTKKEDDNFNHGIWYQAKVSGVWYRDKKLCGEIVAIRVDGKTKIIFKD